jgi:hypothetical protein
MKFRPLALALAVPIAGLGASACAPPTTADPPTARCYANILDIGHDLLYRGVDGSSTSASTNGTCTGALTPVTIVVAVGFAAADIACEPNGAVGELSIYWPGAPSGHWLCAPPT